MPTDTDLVLKCDETADDDFAAADGVDLRKPQKDNSDWDEAVNALQFRDAREFGVGHSVGVEVETGPQAMPTW